MMKWLTRLRKYCSGVSSHIKKVLRMSIPFSLEYLFDNAKEKLSNVLQKAFNMAVEEVAKMTREKVIVVDR